MHAGRAREWNLLTNIQHAAHRRPRAGHGRGRAALQQARGLLAFGLLALEEREHLSPLLVEHGLHRHWLMRHVDNRWEESFWWQRDGFGGVERRVGRWVVG